MTRILIAILFYTHSSFGQLPTEKARVLFESHKYSEAKAILVTVKTNNGQFAEAQYLLGRIATEEKNYDQAIIYFEKSVEFNPRIAEYHNWLGVMYGVIAIDSNPFRQAMLAPKIKNEFEKAAAIDPSNIQTQWGLLHYYIKAPGFLGGSWTKAFDCAKVIAKINEAQGLCAKGLIYESQGNIALAKSFYQNSLQIQPELKEASERLRRISSNN
jgi:tetratricopeptide (TPR) repeat protein